jgi:TonB-dependent receptor
MKATLPTAYLRRPARAKFLRGSAVHPRHSAPWALIAGIAVAAPLATTLLFAADASTTSSDTSLTEIVVTGVRKSLTDEANAKRDATNFTDSIFAEDVAKFSDSDIAEALNRAPGVLLTRDADGSGVQISIRGLGPSFTKVLLNGSQISIASDGTLDEGSSNREVDLDLFPTELFTKFVINKTPMAELLEGGVAGTVNIVNARPFDNPGQHIAVSAQETYGTSSDKASPRGALIVSNTWNNFGALLGLSASENFVRTDGFESIGWTTPNLSAAQCNVPGCNTTIGKGFSFPATVPVNAGNGLIAGTPVNAAFLAAENPNITLPQLSNALMPRLGRDEYLSGTKDRYSALLSLEYRPSESLKFYFDSLYGYKENNFDRLDMDWSLRNSNAMIPQDVTVDANNVVTGGTFDNAQFFLEDRPYEERLSFYNFNPGVVYDINDIVKLEGQFNFNESKFFRTAPSFLFNSPLNSGSVVTYTNNETTSVPTISPNINLDNPNLGWQWNRVNIQNVNRDTDNKGTHWDLTIGDAKVNLKAGLAYDDSFRSITAYDGSSIYQACIISGNASTVNGVSIPCTTGAIPNSALAGYLSGGPANNYYHIGAGNPGYTQFIALNIPKIEAASNFALYNAIAPYAGSSALATPSGTIDEMTGGAYVELNGTGKFLDHDVSYNAGIRYFDTRQTVSQLVTITGTSIENKLSSPYDAFLPSFNVAAHLADSVIFRVAGSRSMTRPNPDSLLPGTTFSDPSAQVANSGNPNLQPYFSDNADLGIEWYTGGPGYISADYFYKALTGFTETKQVSEPFSALGIPLSSLSPTQLGTGINENTIISVNQPVNIDQASLKGIELIWVQPLDFVTQGLGITSNFTHITSRSFSQGVALGNLPGIPGHTYNLGGYYENHNVSVHVTYVYNSKLIAAAEPQNNVPLALIADARGQLDLSADYTLPSWGGLQSQITFAATNITNAPLRTVFGYENAPYSVYYPGSFYTLGLRTKF